MLGSWPAASLPTFEAVAQRCGKPLATWWSAVRGLVAPGFGFGREGGLEDLIRRLSPPEARNRRPEWPSGATKGLRA